MTIAEKLEKIADNVEKVYNSGVETGKAQGGGVVDEDKIIEKTVSGNPLRVDDVSEVQHEVSVMVKSKNLCHVPYIDGSENKSGHIKIYTLKPNTTYTLSADITKYEDDTATNTGIGGKVIYDDGAEIYFSGDRDTTNSERDGITRHKHVTFTTNNKEITETWIWILNFTNTDTRNAKAENIQLEEGATATEYVPYDVSTVEIEVSGEDLQSTKYPVNKNGTVKGIKSISPTMILSSTDGVDIFMTYHKSWGMQVEYDRFWDAFQQNGERKDCASLFAGRGWDDDIYNPKYPINATSVATYMFHQNLGITSTKVPITITVAASSVFNGCNNLKEIPSLKVTKNVTFTSWFVNCYNLISINFTEDSEIGNNIDFSPSKVLNTASITSVVNTLSDTTTGKTLTLSKTAANNAFHSDTNLTPYPYVDSYVQDNGLEITDNGDGTITLNGTAEEDTIFKIGDITLPNIESTITFKGSPNGPISGVDFGIFMGYEPTAMFNYLEGTYEMAPGLTGVVKYLIYSGQKFENCVLKPEIIVNDVSYSDEWQNLIAPKPYWTINLV